MVYRLPPSVLCRHHGLVCKDAINFLIVLSLNLFPHVVSFLAVTELKSRQRDQAPLPPRGHPPCDQERCASRSTDPRVPCGDGEPCFETTDTQQRPPGGRQLSSLSCFNRQGRPGFLPSVAPGRRPCGKLRGTSLHTCISVHVYRGACHCVECIMGISLHHMYRGHFTASCLSRRISLHHVCCTVGFGGQGAGRECTPLRCSVLMSSLNPYG